KINSANSIRSFTSPKSLEEVPSTLNVLCDQYGCATISKQPGFQKGTMMGKGGRYVWLSVPNK
ncbi:TPA: hypothetical protein ACGJVF_003169, partial [Pseudomonas aeruginosa]